jgi:hypothetical protein
MSDAKAAVLQAAYSYGAANLDRVAGKTDLPAFLELQDALFRACTELERERREGLGLRGEMAVYDVLDEDIDHEE